MRFEYYVLNYNTNTKKVELFNIFNNCLVQDHIEKAIKNYIKNHKRYENDFLNSNSEFEALCEEIKSIIKWQEWCRREYEISVGDAFETDYKKLEKWDCYKQCESNIPMITRECIYQYKQYKKGE